MHDQGDEWVYIVKQEGKKESLENSGAQNQRTRIDRCGLVRHIECQNYADNSEYS